VAILFICTIIGYHKVMDINLIIIMATVVVSIAVAIGVLIAYFNKKFKQPDNEQGQKLMLDVIKDLRSEVQNSGLKNRQELQQKLDLIDDKLTKGLKHSSATLQEQFKQSAQIIQEVTGKLTKLDETNKQVLDFSQQLESLQNILKNPKHRGVLGEYFLETLLSRVLPPNTYKMQYKFKNGDIVDAAIFVKDQIIPIDSKFSLEKYNRIMQETNKDAREKLEKSFKLDIKNRIDETSKYIHPEEGTTDFAIMFIPAEGIFSNLLVYKVGTIKLNTQDLHEYALSKKVMIASPNSFFAYLQTILHGLKSMKMEKNVKEIIKKVGVLGKHLNAYEENLDKLGNHLSTTVSTYNKSYKEFGKIDKDIYKITDAKSGGNADVKLIDKPIKDDE